MIVAKAKAESHRRPLDYYETPPHYVRALLDVIGQPRGPVYEPCVGRHAITRYFVNAGPVVTNDINPNRRADSHLDATDRMSWGTLGFNWCITNPPFSDELPILKNALRHCKNVAFLARLSFLEPTRARVKFFKVWGAPTVIVLPRYSFRRNADGDKGSDNQTCIWMIWWEAQKTNALHVTQRREKGKGK